MSVPALARVSPPAIISTGPATSVSARQAVTPFAAPQIPPPARWSWWWPCRPPEPSPRPIPPPPHPTPPLCGFPSSPISPNPVSAPVGWDRLLATRTASCSRIASSMARGGRTTHHATRTSPEARATGSVTRARGTRRHARADFPAAASRAGWSRWPVGLFAGHVTCGPQNPDRRGYTLRGVGGSVPAPRGGCAGTGEVSAGGRSGRRRRPVPG